MRILVVTPYFHPHAGGSQRYIEELYGEVLRQHPDWQVDIVTYNTEHVAKEEHYLGFTVYRVGCMELLRGQFALPNYVELIGLFRRLKRNRYAIVNAHTRFFDTSWWGVFVARYLGAKAMLTDHCAYHPAHQSLFIRKVAETVDHIVIPLLSNMYSQVTVVSEATKRFLKEHGMRRDIEVVYGGVRVEDYQGKRGEREIDGIGKIAEDEVVVTFLGRMIPAKGPHILANISKKLVDTYKHVRVVFAGDGEMLENLRKFEDKKIAFLGNLTRENVIRLLQATDVVVLPSTHHEGLPSVILEAGAVGCAVVTTDRGGVKELVKDEETGLIVQPTEDSVQKAVGRLIEDHTLRKELGSNLKKEIQEQFGWEGIAKKYGEMLMNLAE